MSYEYKVVPAPVRGLKAKGLKGPEAKFANALEAKMNELAAEGWEFQRTETLPNEERSGLTSSTTTYRSIMVFRRRRKDDISAFEPRALEDPKVAELPAPAPVEASEEHADTSAESNGSTDTLETSDGSSDDIDAAISTALKKRAEGQAKS